jgi:hypothetical protein
VLPFCGGSSTSRGAIHVTAEKERKCTGVVVHRAPLGGERLRRSRGFPPPEVNVGIEGYECDWREQRVIVETDGEAAHSTNRARQRDPVMDADLQIAGWRLLRSSSMRLFREPDAVADQLARLLATPATAAPAAPHPR